MIIDAISDLHGYYPTLEGGDLLIIAGDLTARDELNELAFSFTNWLDKQPYKKKIIVAGNHDNILQNIEGNFWWEIATYLCDSGTEFEGLKIWGSPWTKTFEGMNPRCKAFTLDTEEELAEKFQKIPLDTDILVTHGPPYGMQDIVRRRCTLDGSEVSLCEHKGSESLADRLEIVKPRLHVFGHIHEGYGMHEFEFSFSNGKYVKSVNASYVNEHYEPFNNAIRIIL